MLLARTHDWYLAALVATLVLLIAFDSRVVLAQGSGNGSSASTGEAREGNSRNGNGERGRRGERGGGRRNGDRESRGERENDGTEGASRQRPQSDSVGTSSSPATPTTSGFGANAGDVDAAQAAGLRKWASELVKKHDKNGNMMLEADEQADLASSSRGADLNSDGVITIDELVTHLSPKLQPAAASSGFGTQASAERLATGMSDRGKSEVSEAKEVARTVKGQGKSYRFRSVKDRQTSWRFSGKDANGDGQVSMSEYSSSWNDRTAAEFRRYDRDNDGMITSDEVR